MKTAELTNTREITIKERPMPTIGKETDVLIRIKSVGICGSDVHYYTTGRIGDAVVRFPWIVGHEAAGVIEEVGAGVEGLKPGDRVALDPAVSCGECDQCRAGRLHTCRNIIFYSLPGQLEGCFAEYLTAPEANCFPIPESLSFDDATLCEPLAIGMYAVDLSGLGPGDRIAVLGAGPVGLSVMLGAKAAGAECIYAVDPLEYRRKAAESAGANRTGPPEQFDDAAEPGGGFDFIFECCGRQEALEQAVRFCRPGGTIMIIGIPEFERYSFPAHTARRQELAIRHVRRQNNFTEAAIRAVGDGRIDPRFMATHRFGLEETKQAFDLVEKYGDGVIKAIVQI